jgi:hypothetical protein
MTLEELEAVVDEAVTPGFRERLLSKGQARSIIWRDGRLPEGAPRFFAQSDVRRERASL